MINYLIQHDIEFYDVRRMSNQHIKLRMKYRDAFSLKHVRKRYGCKVKFEKRGGPPYYYQKRKKWLPILFSLIFVIGFIFVLSNMIWKVDINGGTQEVRYEVHELIESLGLSRGSFIQEMDSISQIEREIMNNIEEVSYVGIKRTGTSFSITIEENKEMMDEENEQPSNLIASKTGTIQKIYVTNGRPVVHVNDFVQKGDLLVSGQLDEGNDDVYTHSEGEVIAEVWYNMTGSIDLATEKMKLVDDVNEQYSIKFGDFEWFPTRPEDLRLLNEEKKPIYFLFWETPISIQKKYFYDESEWTDEYNEEELILQAVDELLKRKLGQSIDVVYQKVLHEDRDSDTVKIEMFVKVLEDISQEQILNQGD
ncbi:sporulation protein YqfD [Tenuibacillus multivorans]|nr:sporulation protein YqfD [Tenuibacillus multivorans]